MVARTMAFILLDNEFGCYLESVEGKYIKEGHLSAPYEAGSITR